MSKFDSIWNEAQAKAAAADGWLLAITVDSGKPLTTAYLELFDTSSARFTNRAQACRHVIEQARGGSRLHMEALSACSASKLAGATPRKARK